MDILTAKIGTIWGNPKPVPQQTLQAGRVASSTRGMGRAAFSGGNWVITLYRLASEIGAEIRVAMGDLCRCIFLSPVHNFKSLKVLLKKTYAFCK